EHGIAEQVRERRKRAVQAALGGRPPIGMTEDSREIFDRGSTQARIAQDETCIVEREACAERVGISEQRKQADRGAYSENAKFWRVAWRRLLGHRPFQTSIGPYSWVFRTSGERIKV